MPPAQHETSCHGREKRHLLRDEENNRQPGKPQCREHLKKNASHPLGESCAKTQEGPPVFSA